MRWQNMTRPLCAYSPLRSTESRARAPLADICILLHSLPGGFEVALGSHVGGFRVPIPCLSTRLGVALMSH
jgi:hypothetical protein